MLNKDEEASKVTMEQQHDDMEEQDSNNEEELPSTKKSLLEPEDNITSSTIAEDTSEYGDYELPSTPSPSARRKKTMSYSKEWNSLRLTPTNLLSKMMPEKIKEAQIIISNKQKEQEVKQRNSQRERLYRMSRLEVRSMLQSSLCFLDTLDLDSGHTESITSIESWKTQEPSSPSEDKKKWGVKSLLDGLQEGEKQPKKKKSISMKDENKIEKDETSKTKKKKRGSKSKLKKSNTSSDANGTVASVPIEKQEAKKSRSSGSSVRTKDKKKKIKRKSGNKSGKTAACGEGANSRQ